MEILVADDEPTSLHVLRQTLTSWGHNVVSVDNGAEAWRQLQMPAAPPLAVLDWMMPGMDGVDICRNLRAVHRTNPPYVLLLTSKNRKEDVISGLQAGANDYITKPFDRDELRVRLQVGERVVQLQTELVRRISDLEAALQHVQQLRGLLPICSYCKKIRDDKNYWHQLESYFSLHTDAQFSHGICPECYVTVADSMLDDVHADPQRDSGRAVSRSSNS
ncbi:MAG: response regulator transcription factor [Pirellulales bacterium]